jgi:hypothetical protein
MRDAILLVAVFAAAYVSFALLAVSQTKQWSRVMGAARRPPTLARRLRAGGIVLALVGFALALERDGASFGSLLWIASISVGAIAVTFTITWRPIWLRMPLSHLPIEGPDGKKAPLDPSEGAF